MRRTSSTRHPSNRTRPSRPPGSSPWATWLPSPKAASTTTQIRRERRRRAIMGLTFSRMCRAATAPASRASGLRPRDGLRRPGRPALDPGAPGCRPRPAFPLPTEGSQTTPAWSRSYVPRGAPPGRGGHGPAARSLRDGILAEPRRVPRRVDQDGRPSQEWPVTCANVGAACGNRTHDLRITRAPRKHSQRSTSTDRTPHSSEGTEGAG
jgi:hypothetical protein